MLLAVVQVELMAALIDVLRLLLMAMLTAVGVPVGGLTVAAVAVLAELVCLVTGGQSVLEEADEGRGEAD